MKIPAIYAETPFVGNANRPPASAASYRGAAISSRSAVNAAEQRQPVGKRHAGQRQNGLLPPGEMLVHCPLRVFERLGDVVHAQTVATLADEHDAGEVENAGLAVAGFACVASPNHKIGAFIVY